MKRLVADILFVLGLLGLGAFAVQMVTNEASNRGTTAGTVSSHAAQSVPERADSVQTTAAANEPAQAGAKAPQPELIATQPVTQEIVIRTMPAARVWIDGQLRHTSPVFAALPKGHHRIAVGRAKPEQMRELDIHSQQLEPLTLTFDLAH
jgi:hypothetical protein